MLPNFLIIGAAKAGTTSLYRYLGQHPDVYMSPVKETNYYALAGQALDFTGPGDMAAIGSFSVTDRDQYEALFSAANSAKAIGEASPLYLYCARAADRIQTQLPEAKLICILRNPVERAYSSFLMMRRDGREPEDVFDSALELENMRITHGWELIWHYKRVGLYAEQLKRYKRAIDRQLLKVVLYEDLRSHPQECLRELFRFLDIDDDVAVDCSLRHNVSTVPRSAKVHKILNSRRLEQSVGHFIPRALGRSVRQKLVHWNLFRPPMPPDTRSALTAYFQDDVLQLQCIIRRDLSSWLSY